MQERLHELDLLRALALVGVLVIHCAAWAAPVYANPLSGSIPALADLARCSVPVFVLASGFALRTVPPRPGFLARRARRTLVPWLLWAPVFLLVMLETGRLRPEVGAVGTWIAFGGGHLYFLLLIAQLYVVYAVLPRNRAAVVAVTAAALAVQVALGWLHTYAAAPPNRGEFLQAPYYVGYFAAGALLADAWPALRGRAWLPIAALPATLAAAALWLWSATTISGAPAAHGAYAFLWPARVPLVIAGSILVLGAGARLPRLAAIEWLGSRSLGVYVTHPLALMVIGPFTLAVLGAWPRVLLLVGASLAFGWVAVKLLGATRIGAASIGEAPAPRRERAARSAAIAA